MTTDTAVSNTTDKYEIVREDRITIAGRTLYRIRALRDIPGVVNKGDLGGYLSGPESLAEAGNCWVGHEARVWGGAQVQGDAVMTGSSSACGGAIIKDNAHVDGRAELIGKVLVANKDRIGRECMVINATVMHASQFVRNGSTYFTFAYGVNATGGTMALPAVMCDNQTALKLSLLREGGELAVVKDYNENLRNAPVNPDTGYIVYSELPKYS